MKEAPNLLQRILRRVRFPSASLIGAYSHYGRKCAYFAYRKLLVHWARLSEMHLPLPEVGIQRGTLRGAGRGKTSWTKWDLIESTLPRDARNALDIGCNNGFFTLRLASKGLFSIGIDPDEDLLRLAQIASFRSPSASVAFSPLAIDADTVGSLPEADVTLVLSVMHRWIRSSGTEAALQILQALWRRTKMCMYFESPNPCESSKEFRVLSFMGTSVPQCESFLASMLQGLGDNTVRLLGHMPTDFRGEGERRHLFLVRRTTIT